MNKKNFIALADVLKAEGAAFSPYQINVLADFCTSQNPQFDRTKWLNYIAGTHGPGGGKRK